ncbi:MAG: protein kinase [Holophagales bacterium]|nr:protein kinase [Holophagales bacterium]
MNPARIGRYEILRPLGKGAMGVVYLARDPQIERTLALKTVRFDGPSQSFSVSEAKARFLKEAKISGRLQHPNIVTVFDVGEDEGVLYLAMEYISGGALSQRLTDGIEFPIPERIRILSEVADALAHAHQRGVIHRDVKPANILLTEASVAKVTDFGIGKLLTGDTDLTSTGQMVGSPAYMSPEQIRGDKLDVSSDIFSLGVVLYQTLTLKKPFPADTLTTLVYQILHNQPDDPLVHNDELPPEITQIALKCLEKDRENRYGDAVELADDLRAIIGIAPLVSTSGLTESKVGRARKLAAAAASVATPTMQMPAGASPRAAAPPPQTPQPGSAPTEVSASRVMTRTGGRTSTTSSQHEPGGDRRGGRRRAPPGGNRRRRLLLPPRAGALRPERGDAGRRSRAHGHRDSRGRCDGDDRRPGSRGDAGHDAGNDPDRARAHPRRNARGRHGPPFRRTNRRANQHPAAEAVADRHSRPDTFSRADPHAGSALPPRRHLHHAALREAERLAFPGPRLSRRPLHRHFRRLG